MAGRSREYDIAFRLNGIMDPSVRQSMGNAERHIEELERALREMNRRGDLDDLRRDAGRAENAFGGLTDRARSFGDTLNRVAEFTGAKALIDAASGSLQNIVGTIGDQSEAMAQLQAATGVTAKEMLEMKDSANSLYNARLGEDFNDLGNALATVRQVSQASGEELEKMTKNAIVYRDVFGEDITQSIKASDTMMKNFGITSENAYNLLAQGAQKGLNKSDELIDTANEYSVYFSTLGYDAEEMFNQFAAGLDAGAFNLDKVGDAVKEFGIRIKDGSDSTAEAMAMLFAPEKIDDFTEKLRKGGTKSAEYLELLEHVSKDTATQLLKDLNGKGKKAESASKTVMGIMGQGDKILSDLADGAIQGKYAMQQVIDKLVQIEDPILRSTIGVALFGTQFEDMETKVIASLGTSREQFDMTQQTMDEVAKVKYDTLGKDFQAVGRQLMTELVIPIGEDLMPALRGLAGWLGDHTELLKTLALGVPAAMIGKNTIKIVSGLLSVERAAGGAGGAAGGFVKALGFMTNPVGIAITGVGLLTAGVIAYKKHQEEARKALLNMGESFSGAFKQYEEVDHANKRTQNLVREYDRLTKKIQDSKAPADELTEARRKLKATEQELIDMNPDILSAEGSKNSKFREQLDLVKDIQQAKADISKRDLETAVLDAEAKFPELEKTYSDDTKNLRDQLKAYDELKVKYHDYIQYVKEQRDIMSAGFAPDVQDQKQNELVRKINDETGKAYGNFDSVRWDFKDISDAFKTSNDAIKKLEGEISQAQGSMQEYYNLQVKMIEQDLGGSIDQMAEKYKTASDSEKKRFDEAVRLISELNNEVDLLPAEKKINLQVVWQQTGRAPDLSTSQGRAANRLAIRDPGFEGYADGGIATQPSIFGEAGPEIAIPLNNKPRSRSLLDMANDLMGYSGGGGDTHEYQVVYAPKVTIPGGSPDVAAQVNRILQDREADFEHRFNKMLDRQKRVGLR